MTENLPIPAPEPSGQVILYQSRDGTTRIEVRLEGDTVWLPQRAMADLFQTTVPNVNQHLKAIYDEGELSPEATIKRYLIVQTEGQREVTRHVDHYNLEAIIAVGYRVNSFQATQFRIWATQTLREFIIKGFLHGFLELSNYPILQDKGKVSALEAKLKAEGEYEVYRQRQDVEYISEFDREIKRVEGIHAETPRTRRKKSE